MTETDCGISISGASDLVAEVDEAATKPPGSETVMMLPKVPISSVRSSAAGAAASSTTGAAVGSKPGASASRM